MPCPNCPHTGIDLEEDPMRWHEFVDGTVQHVTPLVPDTREVQLAKSLAAAYNAALNDTGNHEIATHIVIALGRRLERWN